MIGVDSRGLMLHPSILPGAVVSAISGHRRATVLGGSRRRPRSRRSGHLFSRVRQSDRQSTRGTHRDARAPSSTNRTVPWAGYSPASVLAVHHRSLLVATWRSSRSTHLQIHWWEFESSGPASQGARQSRCYSAWFALRALAGSTGWSGPGKSDELRHIFGTWFVTRRGVSRALILRRGYRPADPPHPRIGPLSTCRGRAVGLVPGGCSPLRR
jgi:hypothetical protein